MNDKKLTPTEQNYSGKTYAYIAVALSVLSAVAFGLTFTVLGIYSLIASVILSLAALVFVNVQKKKNNFNRLKIIKIAAYIVLCIETAFFIGGIIYSAIN